MIPIAYNVRSLFVRKTTTIATVLGVGLVVFVLASSNMLSQGIKRTMQQSGKPDKAIVMRQGADAEMASNLDSRLVGTVSATPGVKKGADGAPLSVGELVLVIALELIDRPGQVSNVIVRGGLSSTKRRLPIDFNVIVCSGLIRILSWPSSKTTRRAAASRAFQYNPASTDNSAAGSGTSACVAFVVAVTGCIWSPRYTSAMRWASCVGLVCARLHSVDTPKRCWG